jgi:hypothetical protein
MKSELGMFWMDGHPHHCLDFIIYVVVVMVMEEVMVKMVVEMANECLSVTFSTVKIEIVGGLIACSLLTCSIYCNNCIVVIEGCVGEMEEFVLICQWACQKRKNVTF